MNQIELLKEEFIFIKEFGFNEEPFNEYQNEFIEYDNYLINFYNENSKKYIEIATIGHSRVEIIIRRVEHKGQINYNEAKNWIDKYGLALLTHKENFISDNYYSHDLINYNKVIKRLKNDLLESSDKLTSDNWFATESIEQIKSLFPKYFRLEKSIAEQFYTNIKSELIRLLNSYEFIFERDNEYYPSYSSKSWITKAEFYNRSDNVKITFGNSDYRDYTEYFRLMYDKIELLILDIKNTNNIDEIILKIESELKRRNYKKKTIE